MQKRWLLLCNILFVSLIPGVLWQGALFAQSPVEIGSTLETKNKVKLRASPPSRQFLFIVSGPGDEIAKIEKGMEMQVKEIKEIEVPFGNDIWIKGMTQKGETGWVYYGEKNNPTNFLGDTTSKGGK